MLLNSHTKKGTEKETETNIHTACL